MDIHAGVGVLSVQEGENNVRRIFVGLICTEIRLCPWHMTPTLTHWAHFQPQFMNFVHIVWLNLTIEVKSGQKWNVHNLKVNQLSPENDLLWMPVFLPVSTFSGSFRIILTTTDGVFSDIVANLILSQSLMGPCRLFLTTFFAIFRSVMLRVLSEKWSSISSSVRRSVSGIKK